MKYNESDVVNALRKTGIMEGDTVFFTTSLGMLGAPEVKSVNSINDICLLIFNSIKKVLGKKGTILVPTYSYSFGNFSNKKKSFFNPLKTESMIGPFPNFFIKLNKIERSIDPMVSIAGLGPKAKKILTNIPFSSYGKGCIFERILRIKNAKCCNIGLGPNWMPFIHYLDWKNKAPFRYDKFFQGVIAHKRKKHKIIWHYPVRVLRKESVASAHKIGQLACKKGIFKWSKLGRASVYTANYKKYFDFAIKLTKFNVWLTVNGPKFNIK